MPASAEVPLLIPTPVCCFLQTCFQSPLSRTLRKSGDPHDPNDPSLCLCSKRAVNVVSHVPASTLRQKSLSLSPLRGKSVGSYKLVFNHRILGLLESVATTTTPTTASPYPAFLAARSLLHSLAGRQWRALHVPLVTVTSSSRAAMASVKQESDKLACGSD